MKRNIYFHENNSGKGIYRSLKGGFNGFTLLLLPPLKVPLAFLLFYPFSLPKYSANFFTALARWDIWFFISSPNSAKLLS